MINSDPSVGPSRFDFQQLPQRLRDNIQIDQATGCWIWTGCRSSGYGAINFEGKRTTLHRLVWSLAYVFVPPIIHHRCKRRACCNPAHLEPKADDADHGKEHRKIYCLNGHLLSQTRNRHGHCTACERQRKRSPKYREVEKVWRTEAKAKNPERYAKYRETYNIVRRERRAQARKQ